MRRSAIYSPLLKIWDIEMTSIYFFIEHFDKNSRWQIATSERVTKEEANVGIPLASSPGHTPPRPGDEANHMPQQEFFHLLISEQ